MDEKPLDRRQLLAALGAAGVAGVAGCSSTASGATGTLATQVSDQPGDIGDFESCVVRIVGYWLGPAENADSTADANSTDAADSTDDTEETDAADSADDAEETDETEQTDGTEQEAGEREYYELDEPAEADLVELQGDETQLIDATELETGEYGYLQLDTDGVDATLDDGSDTQVMVPGNAPLKFNQSFEIRADTRTVFTADFTPVKRGQTGTYLLQPVASETTVSYETITDSPTTSGNESASSTETESQ